MLTNSGADAISGTFHSALTENGILWQAYNGQDVHNHVPRIWWPDEHGQAVSIDAGAGRDHRC